MHKLLTHKHSAAIMLTATAAIATFSAPNSVRAGGPDGTIPSYSKPVPSKPLSAVEQVRSIAHKILSDARRKADAAGQTKQRAKPDLANASLDRMIGQMIMVGFHGSSLASRDVARTHAAIRSGKVGGVVLLGYNIKSSAQLKKLTRDLKSAGKKHLPPLIGIDQEGGLVQRLGPKQGLRKYPSAAAVAKSGTPAAARRVYQSMARDLANHGVNLNFGPVVDLKINKSNSVIVKPGRSYGKSPKRVTDFATAFIDAHASHGVLTAAKHFPGHGSSKSDSHKGFVDITRTWSETELGPYRALTDKGKLQMVMVGHLSHQRFANSDGRHPATLSDGIVNGLLRKNIGFNGVVITDDFYMAAIRKHYSLEDSFIRAIKAGVDIIMLTGVEGRSARPDRLHAIIRKAVDSGQLSRSRIKQSYERIVRLKRGLFANRNNTHPTRKAGE